MEIEIKNLSLIYPLRSLDHYLFRARIVSLFKNLFKKKKTNENFKKKRNILALNKINLKIKENDREG